MTDKITIERQRFETWALLHHSMRDQEWFTESANNGTLADDLTDSWAAWRAALAAPPDPAAVPLTDDQLRADLISCRGTVKADRNHYERLAEVHRGRITAAAYEAEASRLDALLERIDALIAVDKTKEQTP